MLKSTIKSNVEPGKARFVTHSLVLFVQRTNLRCKQADLTLEEEKKVSFLRDVEKYEFWLREQGMNTSKNNGKRKVGAESDCFRLFL